MPKLFITVLLAFATSASGIYPFPNYVYPWHNHVMPGFMGHWRNSRGAAVTRHDPVQLRLLSQRVQGLSAQLQRELQQLDVEYQAKRSRILTKLQYIRTVFNQYEQEVQQHEQQRSSLELFLQLFSDPSNDATITSPPTSPFPNRPLPNLPIPALQMPSNTAVTGVGLHVTSPPINRPGGVTYRELYEHHNTQTAQYGTGLNSWFGFETTRRPATVVNVPQSGLPGYLTDEQKAALLYHQTLSPLLQQSSIGSHTNLFSTSPQPISTQDMFVKGRFEQFALVPELFVRAPRRLLTVKFMDGTAATLGNQIQPAKTADTPVMVTYETQPNRLYTLIVIDAQTSGRTRAGILHWLVVNINATNVLYGTSLVDYLPVMPPSRDLHRYVYLVYVQQYPIPQTAHPYIMFNQYRGRDRFDLTQFTGRHKLGQAWAGNFFLAQCDYYSRLLHPTLGLPDPGPC